LSFFFPFFFGKVRLSSKNHLAVTEKMVSSGGEAAAGEHRSSFYLAAPSLEFRAPSLSLFPGSFLSRAREGQKREAARLGEQQRHEERASGEESPWFSANDETPNPLSLSLSSQQTPPQQQRLQRPRQRSSFANTCSTRCGPRGGPTRRRTRSEFRILFLSLLFFGGGGSGDDGDDISTFLARELMPPFPCSHSPRLDSALASVKPRGNRLTRIHKQTKNPTTGSSPSSRF